MSTFADSLFLGEDGGVGGFEEVYVIFILALCVLYLLSLRQLGIVVFYKKIRIWIAAVEPLIEVHVTSRIEQKFSLFVALNPQLHLRIEVVKIFHIGGFLHVPFGEKFPISDESLMRYVQNRIAREVLGLRVAIYRKRLYQRIFGGAEYVDDAAYCGVCDMLLVDDARYLAECATVADGAVVVDFGEALECGLDNLLALFGRDGFFCPIRILHKIVVGGFVEDARMSVEYVVEVGFFVIFSLIIRQIVEPTVKFALLVDT